MKQYLIQTTFAIMFNKNHHTTTNNDKKLLFYYYRPRQS